MQTPRVGPFDPPLAQQRGGRGYIAVELGAAGLALFLLGLGGLNVAANRPDARLRRQAHELQRQLWDFSDVHHGRYPAHCSELAGETAASLDYIALAADPCPPQPESPRYRWLQAGDTPRAGEQVCHFILVAYGEVPQPELRELARAEFARVVAPLPAHSPSAGFDPLPPGVDWDRASYALTSVSGRWQFL